MRTPARLLVLAAASVAIATWMDSSPAAEGQPAYPAAARVPVSETFHGVTVVDDYRWMEDDAAPDVKAWVAQENALTRKTLDAVPQRGEIARRVDELLAAKTVARFDVRYRGGAVFAMRFAPPSNQPALVVIPATLDVDKERVVLDPTVLDPSGRTTIDFYTPSHDGKYVALSLSQNGSEDGTACVYEVATGKRLADTVPRVGFPTAGGSIEWAADSKGFYYTRYPADGERPEVDRHFFQTVWYHELGAPVASDRYVIGREFPRIAEIELHASRDGRDLIASVKNGDGGEVAWYLKHSTAPWKTVAGFSDGVKEIRFGQDGNLYARSIKEAPLGRVLAIPLADPRLERARVVVPEAPLSIDDITVARSRLYLQYRDGGPSQVKMFDLHGKAIGVLPSEPLSDTTVSAVLEGDDVLVRSMSFITPPTRYRYDARPNRLVATALNGKPPFNFDDAEVERGFAVSKDGTRVPVTVLHAKHVKFDGNNPTLLYAYGGYGVSMVPWFSPLNRLWLDRGGVYALAGVRGGGEYGEAWHEAGKLTRKQNVFDDFARACNTSSTASSRARRGWRSWAEATAA